MIDVRHIHPRYKRPTVPSRYCPLHKALVKIPKGKSQAKPNSAFRQNSDAERTPRSQRLKAQRLAMGLTRRELDRLRYLAKFAA